MNRFLGVVIYLRMLAGRKILYVIAAMALFVFATKAVPWTLAQFRSVPTFRTSDLRNPEFLPPYHVGFDPSGEYTRRIKVYGQSVTARYKETSRHGTPWRTSLHAETTIEADADETVTLPGGETLRIAALQVLPQVSLRLPKNYPPELVYLQPDGKWMNREEGIEFNSWIGRPGDEVWNRTGDNGTPFNLSVFLETELDKKQIGLTSIRDTITGGKISNANFIRFHDNYEGDQRLYEVSSTWAAVRPSPLALHVLVHAGEPQVVKLAPEAPQSYEWNGHECTLMTVLKCNPKTGEEIIVSGEKWDSPASAGLSEGSKLVFDGHPPGLLSVELVLKSGETVVPAMRVGSQYVYDNLEDPGEIDHIRIELRPELVHVIFRLPDMPVVPSENKGQTNINKMIIPKFGLGDQHYLENLLSCILQSNVNLPAPVGPSIAYPITLDKTTVGDLLAMMSAQYPDSEWVFQTEMGISSIQIMPAGTTRKIQAPVFHAIYSFLENTQGILLLCLIILLIIKGRLLLWSYSLRKTLRVRGYSNFNLWDIERLYLLLGRRAWRIPSYDELAAIPEVDPTSPASIAEVMKNKDR